ncbi:MAG: hypothetical protein JXX29_06415 [Deltaproteobacteria bacterium]|nr:hypothetical protein [Deltaproteobacteria bacterium]
MNPATVSSPIFTGDICDGIDNDFNGIVDDDYVSSDGQYIASQHCGRCYQNCEQLPHSLGASCEVVDGVPICIAQSCEPGYTPSRSNTACTAFQTRVCASCVDDVDCGNFNAAQCRDIFGERRCTYQCDRLDCPSGYLCRDGICIPESGSCLCDDGSNFATACAIYTGNTVCNAQAFCVDGELTTCQGFSEVCDAVDNDCNGIVDDPFVDENGNYNVDEHHCGACGVDCTVIALPNVAFICGGSVYEPLCAYACPDAQDGVQVGDWLDADFDITTGCECYFHTANDIPGADVADVFDTNCDGADGIVNQSVYVSIYGDDTHVGSPKHPVRSITEAIRIATESLDTATPRTIIFITSGNYNESVFLEKEISLFGGYGPDFHSRSVNTNPTVVYAPSYDEMPGGAAFYVQQIGSGETSVQTTIDGIQFFGAAPNESGSPSFAAVMSDCSDNLFIHDCIFRAADSTAGSHGENGNAGSFGAAGSNGNDPKLAREDSFHVCTSVSANQSQGGEGGTNVCQNISVGGGKGGQSGCPVNTDNLQEAGADGMGSDGGEGGEAGYDAEGPLFEGGGCDSYVCCGFADFNVSSYYQIAHDGEAGAEGESGAAGSGCIDPMGTIAQGIWYGGIGTTGEDGSPGSGGGGGGGGGSAKIEWVDSYCEYSDGIGGSGGGGGAGGCGGSGGAAGQSGGPSVALVIVYTNGASVFAAPTIQDSVFISGNGGHGGDGGNGGSGGEGGSGGSGGALTPSEISSVSVSATSSGGNGGLGGTGGNGGSGGGGCGGSVVGIWLDTVASSIDGFSTDLALGNTFELHDAGIAGSGGTGTGAGSDHSGASGETVNVYVP